MNTRTRQRRLAQINRAIHDQIIWMERCGGTRSGYVAKYADCDVNPYGRNIADAEAIFEADMAELNRLMAASKALTKA